MNSETRNCQNCKNDFTIEPDDFSFYEKIKVPPPTWCPECRMIRRMASVNAWSLFYRNCDKCGKRTLSMYPPTQKITVYCEPCWWGDSWDGTEYGMNYDPNRSFLEQLKELSEKTPYVALENSYLTLKNCNYSNSLAYSKNCLLAIWGDNNENVYSSSILNGAKDTADSLRIFKSELCYESIGLRRCYNVFYSQECHACTGLWFSRNCDGCINCIGCANLRGSSYKIFNTQYTKEEYFKKLKEFKLNTRSGIKALQKEAEIFWKKFPYRSYTGDTFNLNVTGEYVHKSKNSKEMYIASHAENCKYCQFITFKPAKDCMDYSGWGNNAELVYECANVGENVSNVKFSAFCFPNIVNVEYCLWCIAGKNNFGCVNLKRKNYCILNKEYSKEEYEKLKEKIIDNMKKNPYMDELGRVWTYGEFFQPGFSKFAYNNSNAHKFFPKTKEEALKCSYTWNDEIGQEAEATISGDNLPETISEFNESILEEIISCTTCNRKYKIASLEFDLLRKMNMPLPMRCLKCREKSRFDKLQMPKLYDRQCNKCGINIRTSYSPDRPEIIYCEKCYQQEVN
ncbi:MAG TPA: hypothetical protein VMR49_03995 [Candidatus Paceibacterota bacterium]|nr:hypothetical protein [Candidatus Paceibacterota bacterium]